MPVDRHHSAPPSPEKKGKDGRDIPEDVAEALLTCGGVATMEERLPSDERLARISAFHRACADPIRLKVLSMLSFQPLCVCVIKEVLGIADSKLSYHLGVLKKAGLITGESEANWIIYSLTEAGRTCIGCRIFDQ